MTDTMNRVLSYRKHLETKLDPMRYEHSLSVSYTCMNLAMRYGYDLDKAEVAGLLHDCGKRFSDEIILKKCIKHGISFTPEEEETPAVLHANYGAWLARRRWPLWIGSNVPPIIPILVIFLSCLPELHIHFLYPPDLTQRLIRARSAPHIHRGSSIFRFASSFAGRYRTIFLPITCTT